MFRIILVTLLFISACSHSNNTPQSYDSKLIVSYSDFGAQVIANSEIGMEWWQWQPHRDSRPRTYDIKVVVYKELTLDKVKNL